MAKELVIKVKIDGQEIDIAKKTTKELTEQISALKTKLSEVPMGSKDFKKIQGDIDNLEKGFQKAKNATQPFLDNMAELPGIAGVAGQSIKGLKQGFDLLASNPIIAVFSLLAMVILKVVDKMKNLEGVMDPINKIGAIFSGIFERLASVVLPPVVATLEAVADAAASVGNFIGKLIGSGDDLGDTYSRLEEQQDALTDSQADYELGLEKSNRALQEAREKANDQTLSTKERKQALEDAAKIEKKIAEEGRARALEQARITAQQMAASMGLTKTEIDGLKKANAAEIEIFAQRIKNRTDLNQEQRNALLKSLGEIDRIAADEAKIEKKKDTQIRAIDNQAAADAKALREKTEADTKDFNNRLLAFQNDIRLLNIKDEKAKALESLQIEKEKTLKEIDELKLSNERKKILRLEALKDYALKEKVLLDKQKEDRKKEEMTFEEELKQIRISAIEDETQKALAAEDDRFQKQKSKTIEKMLALGKTTEEMNAALELIEKTHQNNVNKIKTDADTKNAELVYKRIEFERQSRLLGFQNQLKDIDLQFTTEQQKALDRRAILDKQAEEEYTKEIENLNKLLKAKEITQAQFDERERIQQENKNLKKKENEIKTIQDITKAQDAQIQSLKALGDAIGQVGMAMGENTVIGKALLKVQQAITLATQIQTFVRQVQALTTLQAAQAEAILKGSSLPFPANLLAIATTVATFASIIMSAKNLFSSNKGQPTTQTSGNAGNSAGGLGNNYEDGGMINGPRHAAGGVMINAEGGEAVMTRGAVTMFGPLLSQLNQMGGGTSFNTGITGKSNYDAPVGSEPTIMKTYVVSQEMTSEVEKAARLKDLSTL